METIAEALTHPATLDAAKLGFARPNAEVRAAVAMSGGVDSSAAAGLLAHAGYDVVGLTMQLYDHGQALAKKGACCAGRDIHDARRIAERMNFPHYVLDYESLFQQAVMEEFADAYLGGATPIPCIRCNEKVKFQDLLTTAKDLDADCLVTGHYVRRVMGENGPELWRAADPARDQSYFLFTTTRAQLDYLRFPLGGLKTKAQTRAIAQALGLMVADKPDSQDICFAPDGDYAKVIKRLRPDAAQPGEIRHLDGRLLGEHQGVIHYTIGQRRGLGVDASLTGSEPLYVIKLDAQSRIVTVGPRAALATRIIHTGPVNWLGEGRFEDAPQGGWEADVRIRSTRPPMGARITPHEGGARIEMAAPERGAARGQAAVFYGGPEAMRVLGGGWII